MAVAPEHLAGALLCEVRNLLVVLREAEEAGIRVQEGLLEQLQKTRHEVFTWTDLSTVPNPSGYLEPFLEALGQEVYVKEGSASHVKSIAVIDTAAAAICQLLENRILTGGQAESSRTARTTLSSARSNASSEHEAGFATNGSGLVTRVKGKIGMLDIVRTIGEFRHVYEQCGANIVNEAIRVRYIQVLQAVVSYFAMSGCLPSDALVWSLFKTAFDIGYRSQLTSSAVRRLAQGALTQVVSLVFHDCESRLLNSAGRTDKREIATQTFTIKPLLHLIQFLTKLLEAEERDETIRKLSLSLLNMVIEKAMFSIKKHAELENMISESLRMVAVHVLQRKYSAISSIACNILFLCYRLRIRGVREHLKGALLSMVEEIRDSSTSVARRSSMLEFLSDLCRQPTFLEDIFGNYDCSPASQNVFEEVMQTFASYAYPWDHSMSGPQLLALEAILATVQRLLERETTWKENLEQYQPHGTESPTSAQSDNVRSSESAAFEAHMAELIALGEHLASEKEKKEKMAVAATHFNKNPEYGYVYLRKIGVLSSEPDAKTTAIFLRNTIGLSKAQIGEIFGDPEDFNQEVLKEFVNTFSFTGVNIVDGLRAFLESFRLPGEAQKIQRILETFAAQYDKQNKDLFANADVGYILAYSVIMLNTDLWSPQVKKKMTMEQFLRNLRGIDDGKDLPLEFTQAIYASIASSEIKLNSDFKEPEEVYSSFYAANDLDQVKDAQRVPLAKASLNVDAQTSIDTVRKTASGPATPKGKSVSGSEGGSGADTVAVNWCSAGAPALLPHMCSVLWGPFCATITATFEAEDDASSETQETLLLGLVDLVKLAAVCKVPTVTDTVVSSLCQILHGIGLDRCLSPTQSRLEERGAQRVQRITSVLFALATNLGDTIQSGWRPLMETVIKLQEMYIVSTTGFDVGATSFVEESIFRLHNMDAFEPSETTRAPSIDDAFLKLTHRELFTFLGAPSSKQASSLGKISAPQASSEDEMKRRNSVMSSKLSKMLFDLLSSSKFLSSSSLSQLLDSMICGSLGAYGNLSLIKAKDEQLALVYTHWLTFTVLHNEERYSEISSRVTGHFEKILASSTERGAGSDSGLVKLARKTIVSLLDICQLKIARHVHEINVVEQDVVFSPLGVLLRLETGALKSLAPFIAEKLAVQVKSCASDFALCAFGTSIGDSSILDSVLVRLMRVSDASSNILQFLGSLLAGIADHEHKPARDGQEVVLYGSFARLAAKLIDDDSSDKGANALKLLTMAADQAKANSRRLARSSGSTRAQRTKAVDSWCTLLNVVSSGIFHAENEVRRHSLDLVLAAVNPVAGVRGTIPGVYFAIEIVVLPVLEKLNHMVGKRELQNTTEPMVKEVVAVASKCFTFCVAQMDQWQLPDLDAVWSLLLQSFGNVLMNEKFATKGADLKDSVLAMIKACKNQGLLAGENAGNEQGLLSTQETVGLINKFPTDLRSPLFMALNDKSAGKLRRRVARDKTEEEFIESPSNTSVADAPVAAVSPADSSAEDPTAQIEKGLPSNSPSHEASSGVQASQASPGNAAAGDDSQTRVATNPFVDQGDLPSSSTDTKADLTTGIGEALPDYSPGLDTSATSKDDDVASVATASPERMEAEGKASELAGAESPGITNPFAAMASDESASGLTPVVGHKASSLEDEFEVAEVDEIQADPDPSDFLTPTYEAI